MALWNGILDVVGDFTWSFGNEFLIEAGEEGNFIWKDPDYPGGDNTIRRTGLSYRQWCASMCIPFGRCKGVHKIRDYCGPRVVFKDESHAESSLKHKALHLRNTLRFEQELTEEEISQFFKMLCYRHLGMMVQIMKDMRMNEVKIEDVLRDV